MMIVQEVYDPIVAAVNSTTVLAATNTVFGGFLCTTAGNFNLKDIGNADIIAVIGVVVGQFIPGSLACANGAKVVLSGGAAGTIYHGNS